jgi:hypothetical protein
MAQWTQWIAAAAGVAFLGLVGGGCSEARDTSESAAGGGAGADAEKIEIASETADQHRVEEATEVTPRTVSPETQARIDAYTADALTSLKQSADFLAAQESVGFQTDVAFDVVQANGQVLEFGGTRDFLMRRPDRLRIESIDGNGEIKQLFFDGKSILIDMPNEDAYVRIEKPGTFYAAMDYLVEDLGVPAALDDFTSENFAAGVEDRIVSGFYVQRVMLDNHICEHLAFRSGTVDLQLWVREGEQPVPCRLVITYKKAEGHPQFAADFHDWDFDPDVDDELFVFTPPESAERLQVQALVRALRDDLEGK